MEDPHFTDCTEFAQQMDTSRATFMTVFE